MNAEIPIAKRIELWRLAAGLTKTQLAKACGVTAGAVTHWEKNEKRDLSIARVTQIARACGTDLVTFLTSTPTPGAEKACG